MSTNRFAQQTDTINVLALIKGKERYVIPCDHRTRVGALHTLARWAMNPDLSFTEDDSTDLCSGVTALGGVE